MAAYAPSTPNYTVSTNAPLTSGTNLPNIYGMVLHAAPGNTQNILISLASGATSFFTLKPDSAVTIGPEFAANTGTVYAKSADGSNQTLELII